MLRLLSGILNSLNVFNNWFVSLPSWLSVVFLLWFAFLMFKKPQFISWTFGPALYIYTYHIGSFQSMGNTLSRFETAFEKQACKETIANALKITTNNMNTMCAGIFYDDPKTVDADKLRSAVGSMIVLPKYMHSGINERLLLHNLRISSADLRIRIRIIPQCKFRVGFFPYYFGPFSYMFGAMKMYPAAGKQGFIKCPPMEIFRGSGKSWGATKNTVICYVFAQNNIESFEIDEDLKQN